MQRAMGSPGITSARADAARWMRWPRRDERRPTNGRRDERISRCRDSSPQQLESVPLRRVIHKGLFHGLQPRAGNRQCRSIGVEVAVVPGQQIATLAGLGILHRREHIAQGGHRLLGADHQCAAFTNGADVLACQEPAAEEEKHDHQQRQQYAQGGAGRGGNAGFGRGGHGLAGRWMQPFSLSRGRVLAGPAGFQRGGCSPSIEPCIATHNLTMAVAETLRRLYGLCEPPQDLDKARGCSPGTDGQAWHRRSHSTMATDPGDRIIKVNQPGERGGCRMFVHCQRGRVCSSRAAQNVLPDA